MNRPLRNSFVASRLTLGLVLNLAADLVKVQNFLVAGVKKFGPFAVPERR